MPSFDRTTSPEGQLLKALMDRVKAELQTPSKFVVPFLQNDPDEKDPTNFWMTTTGRLRGRYWNGTVFVYLDYPLRSDITAPPAVTPPPPPPAKPAAARTFKTTWQAIWTQTYQGDGDKRTDSKGNNYLVYGNGGDSFNGTQRSLIGFNYGSIQSALSGSIIKLVQLRMTNVHAYWNNGVDIYFGMHNVTAEPASWPSSGSLLLRRSVKQHFGKPQTKTVSLSGAIGSAFRSGSGKGLAIEAPSGDRDYYGFAAGLGSGYTPPQLIITYTK